MTDSTRIDRALATLALVAKAHAELAGEERGARAEFFAFPPEVGDALAEQRFLEWFLLERHSASLDAVPVEALAGVGDSADPELAAVYAALRNSRAGVFEVSDVEDGRGFWARDLFGSGQYPVQDPSASSAMAQHDLIVGRIFPLGEGSFEVSRAAGCFRNPSLAAALESDVERMRATRRGPVHMQQKDLEAMFFAGAALGDPVGDARLVLARAGLAEERIEDLFLRLASTPFDPARWTYGAGDTLAELLALLAFETDVDLESARRALIAAWPVLAAEGLDEAVQPEPAAEPLRGPDVASALGAFETGRRAGRALEDLFRDLERELGIEGDDEADSGDLPDFPGVVGAMVEEFLWDVEREQGTERAEAYGVLRALGRYASDIGVFENFSREDLLRFVSFWVPESGILLDEREVRALLEALRAFTIWARECHQLERLAGSEDLLDRLDSSLPRVQAVNASVARSPAGPTGALCEVVAPLEGGALRLRDPSGVETLERLVPVPAHGARLASGDRVRVERVAAGAVRLLRCYPPELADIDLSR